jgi:hypothetical protein
MRRGDRAHRSRRDGARVAEMPHLHPTMSELLARVAEKLT